MRTIYLIVAGILFSKIFSMMEKIFPGVVNGARLGLGMYVALSLGLIIIRAPQKQLPREYLFEVAGMIMAGIWIYGSLR